MKFRFPSLSIGPALAAILMSAVPAAAQNPGGFIQKSYSLNARARLTQSQIQSFVRSTRGKFTFPAPYNTTGIRITESSDCGGQDCVNYVGYSYWKNINNHVGSNTMYIMLSLDRNRGGQGPTLFRYDKTTDAVTKVGPLFASSSSWSWENGNGWYFSATQPTKLYVVGYNSPKFFRYDVVGRAFQQIFDISTHTNIFGTNRTITQLHSSDDDDVHSFTVVDRGSGEFLGCGVYWENTATYRYYPRRTLNYDECNLDKSGRWLIMLDGQANLDNRIIDLQNNTETTILDQNGGLGHLDMGDGYAVGADNSNSLPQAFIVIDFPVTRTTKPVGPTVFYNSDWNTSLVNHISHQNRKAGLSPQQQYACGSNLDNNSGRENEIVCFRMDGSYDALIVAPVMTNMNAAGGGNSYAKYPKGNLDVTGQYFIWTSNMAGNRLDAFIVKVPSHKLVAGSPSPADTTPPVISALSAPLITSSGATVTWTTNEPSNSQIEYGLTTAYGSVTTLNGSMVTSHSQNLSGLAASTQYHYRVKSRDAAGNLATSPDATLTTLAGISPSPAPSGDVTPPTVTITAPLAGSTVQGRIKVTASASDNVGVVGVQFKIDGKNLGTEDTVRPFARYWSTGNFTNGTHTITAVARDKAGNTATSQPVTVTVKGGNITGPVTWTNLVNAAANGNTLQENCGGCRNSGAQSLQTLSSGDGYFEFTASETTSQRSVGLSRGNTDNTRADIDFAIALWDGLVNGSKYVEIYENGVYKYGAVPYVTGDVFRIAVVSGVVKYSKNGVVFYTSAKAPSYPLLVDAALTTPGSTIANAMFGDQ